MEEKQYMFTDIILWGKQNCMRHNHGNELYNVVSRFHEQNDKN